MTNAVHVWGREKSPKVVLLHCTLAHGGAWARMARQLADRFYLIAPDMIGHGNGPAGDRDRDYHDQSTEHLRGLLSGQGPFHLVGHSFAGTVALRLAMDLPEQVQSLTVIEPVLFAAAPFGPTRQANAEVLGQIAQRIEQGDTFGAARGFLSVWGGGEDFDQLPETEQRRMADQMWIILSQGPALHEDTARLLPRLKQVRCPALLMEGAESPPVIGHILDGLEAGLTHASRARIIGAGHMAPITHAQDVADRIGAFVAGSN